MAQDGVNKTILYDGVCNLCAGSVRFIQKHDRDQAFEFLTLQSEEGKALLEKHDIDVEDLSTVILIEYAEPLADKQQAAPSLKPQEASLTGQQAAPSLKPQEASPTGQETHTHAPTALHYVKPRAVLRSLKALGFPWSWLYPLSYSQPCYRPAPSVITRPRPGNPSQQK